VRLFYLYQVAKSPFFFPPLGLDPSLYHHWAESIAKGKGMGQTVFQAMPLYPYFLGLVYKMAYPGIFWAKLIQLLLGALSVLFVYEIGNSLFNPTVGWIAALGQTFSGISIFYEELLVPASLVSFLFVTLFLLLLRAIQRKHFLDWLWLGLFLGLTTLANAGILLFLPFLFLWMVLSFSWPFLKKCFVFGMLLLCILLAISVVFFRNLQVAHDPVFLAAHGGINFYIGNHPGATGRFQSLFSRHTNSEQLLQESKEVAEKEAGRSLTASEISRFWFRKGFTFIRREPVQYFRLLTKKLLLFWHGYEIPDVEDYYFFRSRFSVLRVLGIPFSWIIPLGLLGIFVGLRNFQKLSLLYGFLFSQMIALLLVFINSRYRAPLAFSVILFAASAISWLFHLFLEKRYRTLLIAFFLLLHFIFLTQVDLGATHQELESYNVGIALDQAGEHEAAIREFDKALLVYPEDSTFLFALGNAFFRKGDFVNARRRYEEVLLHAPDHADAYFNLGLIHFHEGEWDKAEESFEKSIALKADQPDVYYLLSAIYRKKGLVEKAQEAKRHSVALGADPVMVEKDPEKTLFVR